MEDGKKTPKSQKNTPQKTSAKKSASKEKVPKKETEEQQEQEQKSQDEGKKSVEGKKSAKKGEEEGKKSAGKKSAKKAEEKEEEKNKQIEEANKEATTTEKKKRGRASTKKQDKIENEDSDNNDKEDDKDFKPEDEEQQSQEEKKKPGRRGRRPGSTAKKVREENEDSDGEEVIRATRSTKRTKLDNRELYKNELKNKDFPSAEQIEKEVKEFMSQVKEEKISKELLKTLYSTIDLTSLNSTDGYDYINDWLEKNLLQVEKEHKVTPAAICVYPLFGKATKKKIKSLKQVKTAVVSTCFPTGQTFLEVKLQETRIAAREGADEVDMVVSRGLWNEGSELDVLEEIYETKKACNSAHLKVILENCELKGLDSIYKLSYLSLCAGGDFIKTSTGKGKWGAKPEEFAAMCMALRDFLATRKDKSEVRGIKAAGGISDSKTAHTFYQLFQIITKLTPTPENFRIGASSLAKNIIKDLQE